MKFLSLFIITFTLLTSPVLKVYAQDEAGGEASSQEIIGNPLKDLSTVFAIGLGGAILGASTLSFVEEPSEHLRSIVVGGAIGIIIGVGVVAFKQANVSKDYYEEKVWYQPKQAPEKFETVHRAKWHQKEHQKYNDYTLASSFSLSTSF